MRQQQIVLPFFREHSTVLYVSLVSFVGRAVSGLEVDLEGKRRWFSSVSGIPKSDNRVFFLI